MKEVKNIVSYGGGTNSTALLVGMVERGIKPDAILFADTGGEKPETYSYVDYFSKWLVSKDFPAIKTVKYHTKDSELVTLEQYLLSRKVLPPIAYGFKSCSDKFKIRPQRKYLKANFPDCRFNQFMGIDAGEPKRMRESDDPKFTNVYKLIEWGWNRETCIKEILRAGLCLPGKSSCFYCPNMKPREVLALSEDLKARAVNMERIAMPNLMEIAGLGRSFKWEDLIKADESQYKMFEDNDDYRNIPPCECIDG